MNRVEGMDVGRVDVIYYLSCQIGMKKQNKFPMKKLYHGREK
jgi:hypothetical protein